MDTENKYFSILYVRIDPKNESKVVEVMESIRPLNY